MMEELLGLQRSPEDLTLVNMTARAVIVFATGIVLLRLGARRGLGRNAGFDILLGVVLGSVLSRAINGHAAFFPTLGASAVLVGMHELLSFLASRIHWVSQGLKGGTPTIIRDGVVDRAALRRCQISAHDLEENLRLKGNVTNSAEVAEARLERNGEISVVRKKT